MLEHYRAFLRNPCTPDPFSLKEASRTLLDAKRFQHVEGVHKAALEFAAILGFTPEDTLKLERAVWFHDLAKGLKIPGQLELAQDLGIPIPEEAHKAPSVYHAVIGAWVVPNIFGLQDASIENAVLHHTTGHPSLDCVGQLLFLADYCEEGRGFDSSSIRALIPACLEGALYQVIKEKIIHVLQKDLYLHSASLNYYHFLLKKISESR